MSESKKHDEAYGQEVEEMDTSKNPNPTSSNDTNNNNSSSAGGGAGGGGKKTTFKLPEESDKAEAPIHPDDEDQNNGNNKSGGSEKKTTFLEPNEMSQSETNAVGDLSTSSNQIADDDGEDEGFSEEELRYFRKMFDMFDTDKSGAIGFFEMKNLTKHLGVEMNDDDLRKSMAQIDENGNGDLEFDEFVQWLTAANAHGDEFAVLKSRIRAQGTRPLSNEQISQLHDVFKHFDNDGSGSIDVDELGEVFRAMGQDLKKEELQQLMDQVDDDGSGEMEFDEFLLLMCSNFGSSSAFDQELLEGFQKYDPTKSGMIRCEDLKKLVSELVGENLKGEEVDEVVQVAHTRGDGYVEYMRWESLWDACRGIADA